MWPNALSRNPPTTVSAAVASTSTAVPTTSARSTSLPRTEGRERVTCIAASSPCRIEVIIPVAAHANSTRLTSPAALDGLAIAVIAFSTSWWP